MSKQINKAAIFAVFSEADDKALSFADRLMALGVGDRATARPLAVEWASKKYGAPLVPGQRKAKGQMVLPRDSAAEKAMHRVLSVCFPAVDTFGNIKGRASSDPVEKLVKLYRQLSGAEKRRFLKAVQ